MIDFKAKPEAAILTVLCGLAALMTVISLGAPLFTMEVNVNSIKFELPFHMFKMHEVDKVTQSGVTYKSVNYGDFECGKEKSSDPMTQSMKAAAAFVILSMLTLIAATVGGALELMEKLPHPLMGIASGAVSRLFLLLGWALILSVPKKFVDCVASSSAAS